MYFSSPLTIIITSHPPPSTPPSPLCQLDEFAFSDSILNANPTFLHLQRSPTFPPPLLPPIYLLKLLHYHLPALLLLQPIHLLKLLHHHPHLPLQLFSRGLGPSQGVGIRGEIVVLARRLELKHDATEVELTSTVRFYYTKKNDNAYYYYKGKLQKGNNNILKNSLIKMF